MATLTCDDLDELVPGLGEACADDDLREVDVDTLTLVDATSRAPIVTLEGPKAWVNPSHGRVDRVVAWVDSEPSEPSLTQLRRTVRAFVERGWRCSDPALPSYLADPRSIEGLPRDEANASSCRLEHDHPSASPWRCESPAGGPRIVLRLELYCSRAPSTRFRWGLFLDQVDIR
jgi:hypothetical protein